MDGLQVKFQKQLKNFPLCIQFEAEGGCVGILGASGCGKSMTLKTIAGIETPDTGRICLGGRELFHRERNIDLPSRKRSVGYLFQNYALFPNMTVQQNIEAGISGQKAKRKQQAIRMAERFHVSELLFSDIQGIFQEGSSKEWRWHGSWHQSQNFFCWMNHLPHWTVI